MSSQLEKVYQGIIIEEDTDITLIHLCRYCNHSPEEIVELVNEGILEPVGRVKHEWRFTFTSIERVKKAKRLQRDFELNLPGVAIALHLLDRIEQLESMLNAVKK